MSIVETFPAPIVIVGASHAGLAVATELRNNGYESEIVLIGDEACVPYHRPHLSKESLAAEMPGPKPIRPEGFYAERAINLHLGVCVKGIDRYTKTLYLSDGRQVAYGALILATGARARSLPGSIEGAAKAVTLRDRKDWQALSDALRTKASLAVIGGGLIGLEVAAAARERGLAVTVIEAAPRLMMRSLYPELAAHVLEQHRDNGIDIRLGVTVTAVTEQGVSLADGTRIDADLVLASVGSVPRVELAIEAGLLCGNGVDTDGNGRTSDPAIFALGDCAHWDHSGTPIRHESVAATQFQARAIAATLTGQPLPSYSPFRLWSFQGKQRLQMSGQLLPGAQIQIERLGNDSLLLRAFHNDMLIAVQALNAPRPFIAAVGELEAVQEGRVTG